ncbi:MAG TPA: hypothetical protein VMB34_18775 [Acetobacteraceae bacterium]|nr:hypothetical protein [Acetobacteraceae bacterium]
MSCLIKLYEINTSSPPAQLDLTAGTVELVAVDEATHTNCCGVQTNGLLTARGYGADLPFGAASFVYQVAIVDTALVYGGVTIPSLSGNTAGDLDVVLYKLPPPGTGGTPATTAAQARNRVLTNALWSVEQRLAVLSVMNALGALRGVTTGPLLNFIDRHGLALSARGINPALF